MNIECSKTNNHLSIINNHCALGISTTVEESLQISSFMQNKANFGKAQMNVNKVITEDYENKTLSRSGKNKPNSNPNKANLRKAKMNVNFYSTKDYENIANCKLCENKPNSKPIQTQTKPISKAKNAAASVFKRGGTKGFDLVGLNVNEVMDYKHNILLTDFEVSSESLSNKLRMGK